MADGGSINLRLSLKGAEQVRAELDRIGPAGAKMGRELDRAMRAPSPGIKALDAGVSQARGSLEGFAGRIGPVGTGLAGLGAAGLAVAGGIAAAMLAVAAAVQQASAAMRFADDLDDAAGKINIGVEALQEWRFAAAEAGATAADADRAIDDFQKKLGEAGAGGRAAKWFERLGIGSDQLKSFKSTEEALDATIRKISELGTEAERAAVSDKLGLGPLIPLIRQGADAIADMRQQARDLGIVMDEAMVKRGAESAREMEVLSQVIDMQLKQAFIDLGPVLVSLLGLIAKMAEGLRDALDGFKALDQRATASLRNEYRGHSEIVQRLMNKDGVNSPDDLNFLARRQFNQSNQRMGEITHELAARAANRPDERPDGASLIDLDTGGGGGGPSAAERAAERRAREAERALEELRRLERRQDRTVPGVMFKGGGPDAEARLAAEMVRLDAAELAAAREALRARLEANGALTAEVQARLDVLAETESFLDSQRLAIIAEERAQDRRDAMQAAEDAHLEITTELLSLASSQVRTSDERRAIELSLLAIAQRRQKADLEAAIEAEEDAEARAKLVEALARLPALFAGQAQEVERQTANPVRAWRDAQRQSGAEASEWMQGQALDALDSVNAGLRDALVNADSASDAFKRMGEVAVDALSRVADALLEIALQRMLIEPLAGALFGDGQSGGGGGLLGGFMGNLVGGLFGGGGGASPAPGYGHGLASFGAGFLPRKARGGVHSAAGRVLLGEYGMEAADLPIGSRIYDTDRTERALLDFDNRLRANRGAGAPGGQPIVNLTANVINRTSEPVQAKMTRTPQGLDIILEPAVRAGVARMGADGSLDRAHGLRPKPIKR